MFPYDNFSFEGENPLIKILTGTYRSNNSIDYMLQQDNSDYKYKINELRNKIDKALEQGNSDLFMSLSKKYNMMLAEM
jgi:ElaB/YqjD/DUF883 family membrane-anchored ribosome-binding protein